MSYGRATVRRRTATPQRTGSGRGHRRRQGELLRRAQPGLPPVLVSGYVTVMNAQSRPGFDAIDADKSGYLEAPELISVTLPAGLDRNADGKISWNEYREGAK